MKAVMNEVLIDESRDRWGFWLTSVVIGISPTARPKYPFVHTHISFAVYQYYYHP
jgi:hypothetical protein